MNRLNMKTLIEITNDKSSGRCFTSEIIKKALEENKYKCEIISDGVYRKAGIDKLFETNDIIIVEK